MTFGRRAGVGFSNLFLGIARTSFQAEIFGFSDEKKLELADMQNALITGHQASDDFLVRKHEWRKLEGHDLGVIISFSVYFQAQEPK